MKSNFDVIWDGKTYRNPVSGKELLNVSFSGGRTSAYMTKKLIDECSHIYDFIVVFANTSREHNKTLEFIDACDRHFNFGTVWVEAVVHHGVRRAPTHRVVSYDTAAKDGSVFEEFIKKAGIPNIAFPQCTRDLKLKPMQSYLRSLGIDHRKIKTAIGIREDEKRRVSKHAGAESIVYPLVDWWPTDKGEVLDWWKSQPFDLEIDEFEGNCLACFKKSRNKLFMQANRDVSVFLWNKEMEDKYRNVGPQAGERVFFRGNLDTVGLLKLWREVGEGAQTRTPNFYEDGGCSESCEVYETSQEEQQ